MPRQSVESDEELQAQEINSDEDLASNSVSRKRIQKPSTKQKEIGKTFLCSFRRILIVYSSSLTCRRGKPQG